MKTKLEMAHEWAMKHGNAETVGSRQNMIKYAWDYADAMQAEADKREPSEFPNVLRGACGEIVAVKVDDIEWQPDWGQAPNGYDWFVVGGRSGKGFFCLVEPAIVKDHYWFVGEDHLSIDKHNYQGDWRESLRKRPK